MASPSYTETSPLLNGSPPQDHDHNSFSQRLTSVFKAEDEPSWPDSIKSFFFGTYLNILLVFVPLSIISHNLNWDAALRFSFSFLAIIPLAKLLGECTEQMSFSLGDTLAGLLNASFGNAVEIIVGVAALLQDEVRIVQTSMLGSILSNILLVLGCSFVAGGFVRKESNFQVTAAQAKSVVMVIAYPTLTYASLALVLPAAYYLAIGQDKNEHGLDIISRGTSVLLLAVYVIYIVFQLKTHAFLYDETLPHPDDLESNGPLSEGARQREERRLALQNEPKESPKMNLLSATLGLLLVTVVTSFCADYLVASIEETAVRYHIPKTFIGLILLPIVANAAEHVTSVWMAMKNKMEITIGICVGSSIQIAALVIPLLVIVGWCTGHNLTLYFANFETVVFFVSVFLTNTLIQDGKSNYMEGVMLLTLYLVIALAFWVS
ncbi:Vacuolar calcium ion transporter [Leucoagaricus sp. SymC.cos]|nr:Vacuolar calcium ion transporter [Leucoagaricus sp. SymC.cos]